MNEAAEATKDDSKRREVSAPTQQDMDDAIRAAAKLAIDGGDLDRARALLNLLDATLASPVAPVLALTTRKP